MAFICQCMFSCLSTLKHTGVYMYAGSGRAGDTAFAVSLARPCGMRLHILHRVVEWWGNLLLSKIIGLLHPVIWLIVMKASLQFSNYNSMSILFLSNKEEHWCKTKCQDSISCLCLRAIQRWGMYTPSKYQPQYPTWNISLQNESNNSVRKCFHFHVISLRIKKNTNIHEK